MDGYRAMVINVAMTGAVPKKRDNPNVPLTPEEIAADAIACAEAGASVVHLHVRDEDGNPVHRRRPVWTRHGADPRQGPGARRVRHHKQPRRSRSSESHDRPRSRPRLRPDLGSLTLGSFNFPKVISANPPDQIVALLEHMGEQGIRPELEVFELGMVNTLHSLRDRGLIPDPPIVNILLGSSGSAPAFVGDLGHIVERLPSNAEWAAAGIGIFQRPITLAAAAMDGNVRTGLEDNPRGHGEGEWSNVDAVSFCVAAAAIAGRAVATPEETRAARTVVTPDGHGPPILILGATSFSAEVADVVSSAGRRLPASSKTTIARVSVTSTVCPCVGSTTSPTSSTITRSCAHWVRPTECG